MNTMYFCETVSRLQFRDTGPFTFICQVSLRSRRLSSKYGLNDGGASREVGGMGKASADKPRYTSTKIPQFLTDIDYGEYGESDFEASEIATCSLCTSGVAAVVLFGGSIWARSAMGTGTSDATSLSNSLDTAPSRWNELSIVSSSIERMGWSNLLSSWVPPGP